jgi:phage terminase Nu1 subunit (DNA packaging protein)
LKLLHKANCLREIIMEQRAKKQAALKVEVEVLTGWQQIAAFLGHPAAVVQRWASEGMPVRRQGRFVTTTPEELNAWLGRESGKPVHVATEDADLAAELMRGLAFVRREKEPNAAKKLTARSKKAKRRG